MRTRFPPSPTGFLHVGGLRTALYAYLLAKQSGGTFLLRIEDTDVERTVPGAIENILHTLHWAGLHPDEGVILRDGAVTQVGSHGPYIQSQRLSMYQEHARALIAKGAAYPCFCSTDRLAEMRREQSIAKQAPMYDRLCLTLSREEVERRLSMHESHVVRLNVPRERTIILEDAIRGRVSFRGDTVDDQVLLKSDGFPTYHLAHVVDDHLMAIDLVLRGEEWLSSTPKHLLLFEAFGWTAPRYAHVPLLLNKDRSKLSKREGDSAVEEYIARGYLPEALVNFVALLGWNPGTPQEIFSLEELVNAFSLEHVQKAGAILDLEKLTWLQGQWMRRMDPQRFAEWIRPLVEEKFPTAKKETAATFERKARLIQERITFFSEAPDMMRFFYEEPEVNSSLLVNEKQKVTPEALPEILALLKKTLESVPEAQWCSATLLETLTRAGEHHGYKRGQLLWPLRVALTGREFSPGAVEVAEALGRETTQRRLRATSL